MRIDAERSRMRRPWSLQEERMLRECWPNGTDEELLAALPGRNLRAIKDRAQDLRLVSKRPPVKVAQSWRKFPPPEVGSCWRVEGFGPILLPNGDWRVLEIEGGGVRVVFERLDTRRRMVMRVVDFSRLRYRGTATPIEAPQEQTA